MLRRLTLENYRCYDNHVVEFSEDLTTIKGRNGTGKTSIVEAIGFALFGSALQRGKAGEWISFGAKTGKVILEIDDFKITRSHNLAIVETLDGEVIARNNTGISQWVEKQYGLTAELFKTSFYIGQKDINSFALLGPVERVKRVEKLLRIDRLDELKDKAKALVSARVHTVQSLKDRLDGAVYDKAEIERLTSRIQELSKTVDELNVKLEADLIAYGEYKSKLSDYQKYTRAKKNFKGINYDIESLETVYNEAVVENAKIDENNRIFKERQRLEKNLANVTICEKYFTKHISDFLDQRQIANQYKKQLDRIAELECEAVKHDNLTELHTEILKLEGIIDTHANMPEVCPTCGQDWPEAPVDVAPLKIELKEKKLWYEEAVCEDKKFRLETALVKPELSDEEIADGISSLNYKQDYIRLQQIKDTQYLEPVNLNVMLQNLNEAKSQMAFKATLDELGEVEEPKVVNVQVTKDSIQFHRNQIKTMEQELADQRKAQAIEEEYRALYESQHASLKHLREFVTFIDKYRKAFGQNVIPLLESNVSSIVSFLSEGKFERVIINPDYSIKDFDIYSGSEQDSISFAMRLALAQVSRIGSFKTMLLDEVAASFDKERELLLLDILKAQDNQLIYITHGDI
jgi:DNA repair exonuclease SbcCD ATPase subunit